MGEVALRKTQAAIEVTRGTQLAATRKVYGTGHFEEKVNPIRPVNEQRGSFTKYFRSQAGLIDSKFPFDGTVTFEDIAWWFQLALKGGVTGALRNTAAYDYIFVPTQAVDDLKSITVEWGDDTQAFKAGYGMVDTFDISAALGGALTFKAGIIVDDFTTATFTGSLADRVTEDALSHMAKLALGNAGAVPSSYMTGRFIGFTLKINNHLNPKFFMDGATAKLTGMGRAEREYQLDATFEGNAATITERALYDSFTARVARLTVTGSNIAGASPATPKAIDVVLPGIWTAYPVGERGTNTVFNATLEAQYDSVLGYDLSAAVTNGLVSLP